MSFSTQASTFVSERMSTLGFIDMASERFKGSVVMTTSMMTEENEEEEKAIS
jgi:hypothetical protein